MRTPRKNILPPERISLADKMFGVLIAGDFYDDEMWFNIFVRCLTKAGCLEQNIKIRKVPTIDEIPLGVLFFAEYTNVDAVAVFSAEVPEDFIRQAVYRLEAHWNMPVLFSTSNPRNDEVETTLQHTIEVALLQEAMEAEFEEAANPDRMSIN